MNANTRLRGTHGQSGRGSAGRRRGRGSRNTKLVAAAMVLGIVVIGGGSVFAATRPTWQPPSRAPVAADGARPTVHPASAAKAETADHALHAKSASAPARSHAPHLARAGSPMPPITYTVKAGDTLSGIAEWFKLHGYGGLYQANKSVIGADPNLIFPGQRITIAHGAMSLQSQSHEGSGA